MDQTRHMDDGRAREGKADPVTATIEESLKVGAVCGSAGFLLGGAAGIVKGAPPFLFATASGIQTLALGTTYWGCRATILQAWTPTHQTPSDLVKGSTISGGLTGATVALLTRGRSNVIPGAIMFSLFGCLGQAAYNHFSARPELPAEPQPGFWKRMSEKKFSPVQIMSNAEYAELLREKLLKVDVEIAILDDKIAALREEQQSDASKPAKSVGE